MRECKDSSLIYLSANWSKSSDFYRFYKLDTDDHSVSNKRLQEIQNCTTILSYEIWRCESDKLLEHRGCTISWTKQRKMHVFWLRMPNKLLYKLLSLLGDNNGAPQWEGRVSSWGSANRYMDFIQLNTEHLTEIYSLFYMEHISLISWWHEAMFENYGKFLVYFD